MLKRILIGMVVYFFCQTPAFAGNATGQVTQIIVRASDGLVYFFLSGTPVDRPSCANNEMYWIIKDENSETGKRQLALLMEAQAAGREISVLGFGTCSRWHDGEDVGTMVMSSN